MTNDVQVLFDLLYDKDNRVAYKALQELEKESEESDAVYRYMDQFGMMLENDNSYIRTRGLYMLAYNAKWDTENKLDEIIDQYLKCVTDSKPITARQCIKLLPMIAKSKRELRDDILFALKNANTAKYADSMQPLICKDIQAAVKEIERGNGIDERV